MLVLMISNCSGEMSFSKLKLFKDKHRFTMSQTRLVHMTALSTEWDTMRRINFDKIFRKSALPNHVNDSLVFENVQKQLPVQGGFGHGPVWLNLF